MGNSGAYFIGALVSLILIKNYNTGILKLEEVLILSLIPILDMFRVIFLRVTRGYHPFKKDELHLHHIIKKRTSNTYLWQVGSILTLTNIILLKIIDEIHLILPLAISLYLMIIFYLSQSKKK